MQKPYSKIGFVISLSVHLLLLALLFFTFKTSEVANSYTGQQADQISMEMLLASLQQQETTTKEVEEITEEKSEPEPEQVPVEKTVVAEPLKPEIADPLLQQKVKPKPQKQFEKVEKKVIEKPKEIKSKVKKIEKTKPEKKIVKKAQQKKTKSQGQIGNASVNSVAQGRQITTTQPNLQGSGMNSDAIAAYRSALRREIERHKRYSQRAKMLRQQGIVVVGFKLMNDGKISDVYLLKSSGYSDLDQAALKAVSQANSVGNRPVGLADNISIPIKFSLR